MLSNLIFLTSSKSIIFYRIFPFKHLVQFIGKWLDSCLAASFGWLFGTIIVREKCHSIQITMLPLALLISIFIWNNRIESYRIGNFNYTVASADDRSGGFPKFPQSFLLVNNQNQFYHQFYFPSKNHEDISTPQNTCGTRSVQFNPKRSGKIIGGNCQIKVHLFLEASNPHEWSNSNQI